MSLSLMLAHDRRATVWFDELPAAQLDSHEYLDAAVPAHRQMVVEPWAIVEAFVPRGPRYLYGLLGAQLTSSYDELFHVRIPIQDNPGPRFSSQYSVPQASVHLPRELAEAALEGITSAAQSLPTLVRATMTIRFAACDPVGSVPVLFRYLGSALVRLTSLPKSARKDQGIRDIINFPEQL
jgi:hypothetical protein